MPAHAAQFYGDDRELAASVRSFLAEGLPADGAGVVVATAAHRRMFGRLADGVMIVDADETLRGFLTGDVIDEPRFRAAAKDLIWHAAGAGRSPSTARWSRCCGMPDRWRRPSNWKRCGMT